MQFEKRISEITFIRKWESLNCVHNVYVVLAWECEMGLVAGHWLCFRNSFVFLFVIIRIRENVSELRNYSNNLLSLTIWPVSVEMKSQIKLRDVIEHSQGERGEDQTEQQEQSHTGFVKCLQWKHLWSVLDAL